MLHGFSGKRFGLIGGKLSHSFSPQIHALLADYDYTLFPMPADALQTWFADCPLDGFNVTIPYKEAVIPYCAALSDRARKIGSVNTIVRREDGTFYGDNTDYFGFSYLVSALGVSVTGKKALIFGSGGSAHTVRAVLSDLGASEIVTVSRTGENNYLNLDRHADAGFLVNTTPVGMYPHTGISTVDPALFPQCAGALDLIYNPSRTAFLLRCDALGIPCANGLPMLVAQAAEACRVFTDTHTGADADVLDTLTPVIVREIEFETKNIVLIGMPGSGKTECGRALADMLRRPFRDTDDLILAAAGRTPAEIILVDGEATFRTLESRVLADMCHESGLVIATGGGAVTVPANRDLLRQNGSVVFLDRDKAQLATEGRPLSARIDELYDRRMPLYRAFADITVQSRKTVRETAEAILQTIREES
ncbi:MAG: shikimate kinase [Clostridiaceae bacterium]|nr:shikimate kinase [Clostridiaceae bacterium]